MRSLSGEGGRIVRPMPRPHPLPTCAPDAEYHEYDVWGEHDEGSLEGSEDADAY
jgi:hypothetical protein